MSRHTGDAAAAAQSPRGRPRGGGHAPLVPPQLVAATRGSSQAPDAPPPRPGSGRLPHGAPGVLVVSRDASVGAELVRRCGGAHRAECVPDLAHASAAPRDAVVVVADRLSWAATCEAIAHARGRSRAATLLLYLRRDVVCGAMIDAARRAGVDYIAIEGIDDVADRLPVACWRSEARARVAEALQPVIADAPMQLQRLLRLSLARAAERTSVAEAARLLCVHRKTLFMWCREACLGIGPHGALLWPRVLMAARMLERGTPRIQAVALELGFGSGASLGSAMRRLVGRTPTEIIARGAFATVLAAFRAATPPTASAGWVTPRPGK